MTDVDSGLTPALTEVLSHVELLQRPRYVALFRAAVRAIDSLGELELSDFESDDTGPADLSTWELLAPAVKETLEEVNGVLDVVNKQFLVEEPSTAGDSKVAEAMQVVSGLAAGLAKELAQFGEAMRRPQVAADRWKLLDLVALLRGKARSAVGEMVFAVAKAFGEVRKVDVVPSYDEDMESSVQVRRGIMEMRRSVRIYHATIRGAQQGAPARGWGQKLADEVAAYRRTPAYGSMRAADKRTLIEEHKKLTEELRRQGRDTSPFYIFAEGLVRFFDSLLVINRRELLMVHDRAALKNSLEHLQSSIDGLVNSRRQLGQEELAEGYAGALTLYGREMGFDNVLTTLKHVTWSALPLADVLGAAEMLKAGLERIQL